MAIIKVRDQNGNIIEIPALRGKTAYQYAQDGGYTGTETEFKEKMAAEWATKEEVSEISEAIEELKESGTAQANSLWAIIQKSAFTEVLTSEELNAFKTAWGITDSGETEPDEPTEPDTPEVTLTSISATYTGGEVATGTPLTDLTGITVIGTYSDGTTKTITGYSLSGDIVEGESTITVSYGGKTTTFTVIGVAESGGENDTAPVIEHEGYNLSTADGSLVEMTGYSVTGYYEFEQLTEQRQFVFLTGSGAVMSMYDSSNVQLDYFKGTAANKTSNVAIGSVKARFAISNAYIDTAYAYWSDTGEVIFACKNSPYYGKANIDGTSITSND